MKPAALLTQSDDVTARFLPPVMRIGLVLFLLLGRFIGGGDQLRRTITNRPHELIIAPHLERAFGAFYIWPPPPWLADVVGPTLLIMGACAVVGLATRLALFSITVAFIVFYAIVAGFGFFNHTPALGAQVMIALVVAPGVGNLSIDGVITRWWRRRRQRVPLPLLPPTAPFGAMLIMLTVGVVYLASGLAKLRYGGVDWFDGTTLQFYLAGGSRQAQTWLSPPGSDDVIAYTYMAQPSSLARAIATCRPLCAVLSWATLVIEAGAPVFLLIGMRARLVWCALAVGFHLAVLQMMAISFSVWVVIDVIIAAVTLLALWHRRKQTAAKTTMAP